MEEAVNHPEHYNKSDTGIECIELVRNTNFNIGSAVKYIWRHKHKGNPVEDIKKALWYMKDYQERWSYPVHLNDTELNRTWNRIADKRDGNFTPEERLIYVCLFRPVDVAVATIGTYLIRLKFAEEFGENNEETSTADSDTSQVS